ncbi:hypothetical protein HY480_04785 [Candidatus Uhrbacteria bacterium]|nr:hypothetical protein [Candidatus Uhrbacteria bacterium]
MGRTFLIISALMAAAGTVVLLAVPSSRTTVTQLCTNSGLCDQSFRAPEAIDLIVDVSDGSSGTREHVEQTLDVILPWIGSRPGSALRVIIQGARAADSTVIATVVSTVPIRTNAKARDAHLKRFMATTRELLAKAMEPVFAQHASLQQSPTAETISWVALLSLPAGVAPGTPRRIILIADAREVSKEFGDFECGALPTSEAFLERLRAHDVFTPTSLERVRLHFTFTEPKTIARRRCPPMTVARIRGIQGLWTAAANHAGALEITFSTGAITLYQNETEDAS